MDGPRRRAGCADGGVGTRWVGHRSDGGIDLDRMSDRVADSRVGPHFAHGLFLAA